MEPIEIDPPDEAELEVFLQTVAEEEGLTDQATEEGVG